jgi:hypothetical protein
MTRSLAHRSGFATAEQTPLLKFYSRFRSGDLLPRRARVHETVDEGRIDSGLVMSISPSFQQQKNVHVIVMFPCRYPEGRRRKRRIWDLTNTYPHPHLSHADVSDAHTTQGPPGSCPVPPGFLILPSHPPFDFRPFCNQQTIQQHKKPACVEILKRSWDVAGARKPTNQTDGKGRIDQSGKE